jgi:hypothetical protein
MRFNKEAFCEYLAFFSYNKKDFIRDILQILGKIREVRKSYCYHCVFDHENCKECLGEEYHSEDGEIVYQYKDINMLHLFVIPFNFLCVLMFRLIGALIFVLGFPFMLLYNIYIK